MPKRLPGREEPKHPSFAFFCALGGVLDAYGGAETRRYIRALAKLDDARWEELVQLLR